MSQWGAYGAATRGLSHTKILDFYYPGTATSTLSDREVRVRLTTTPSSSLTALMSPTLQLVRAKGSNVQLGASAAEGPVTRWRLLPDGGGLTLQWYSGGQWHTGRAYRQTRSVLGFAGPQGATRVLRTSSTARAYPGSVLAVPQTSSIRAVNVTTYDDYLRGVVPNEMPASWPAAALRAQAVAARTYAAEESSGGTSEICDTTACQVYDGLADYGLDGILQARFTDSRSDAAVSATTGSIRTWNGKPAFTQFSASNGGWTAEGSQPYLKAKADPYDGAVASSAHSWNVTSTTVSSRVQKAYPQIGSLRSMEATRDGHGEWGGRVTSVALTGSRRTTTISARSLRDVLGLKSTWFTVRNPDLLRRDVEMTGVPAVVSLRADGVLQRQSLAGTTLTGATDLGGGWSAMAGVAGAGDLDGDGRGDLVAKSADGVWWCYPMRARGVLNGRTSLGAIPSTTNTVTGVGDVTGDGRADLLGVDHGTGILWLYPGDGRCSLGARKSLGQGWNSMDVVVGAADTTSDGRGDLWAREAATGTLWTYRFDGNGHLLWPRVRVGSAWETIRDLAPLGDATGDGASDLLVRDVTGRAWLYPGKGNGMFGSRAAISGLGSVEYVR